MEEVAFMICYTEQRPVQFRNRRRVKRDLPVNLYHLYYRSWVSGVRVGRLGLDLFPQNGVGEGAK